RTGKTSSGAKTARSASAPSTSEPLPCSPATRAGPEDIHATTSSRGTPRRRASVHTADSPTDRKSTRLNSSHVSISYAVFCLKKKKLGWIKDKRRYRLHHTGS